MALRDVRFAYPEKPDQLILDDIVLAIPAGKFIGIAGPSGCGKSSLIKVIDKLEKAQGEVLLGGVPLSGLTRAALSQNVALVPQTPFLTADTVYHNICYGMKREVALEEVREAARKANIAADIEQLEAGISSCWPRAGATCPAASASASRWPASSFKSPASSSWTRPPPRWTTPPKSASRPRSRK